MTHITIEKEKLEQVLKALEFAQKATLGWTVFIPDAITAIKQALAAPTVQEPAACGESINKALMDAAPLLYQGGYKAESAACNAALLMLMAAQPAPVPLTPEQRRNLWVSATIELPSQENCYYRGIADSEEYHGITEKGRP
jgi:hypothetical protein